MGDITVHRSPHVLRPNPARVVGRPYFPGEDPSAEGQPRLERIVSQVVQLTDAEAAQQLSDVRRRFGDRHRNLDEMLLRNAERAGRLIEAVSHERRLVIGAYFTHEVAFEAAALTNPSMVHAPDQSGLGAGEQRFVMSLRAVGEGHISSIELRTGVLGPQGSIDFEGHQRWAETGERRAAVYERKLFGVKLAELGADAGLTARVLDQLARHFGPDELERALTVLDDLPRAVSHETVKLIRWLASSNYVLDFDPSTALDERLIYPIGPFESRGMEDARFVQFFEDDGTTTYYATYTAFDGFEILPQLIETNDFRVFEITTMNGKAAQNKGMALFPRPIAGRYVALSRPDRENIHLVSSDNPRFWHGPSTPIRTPQRPWELVQMGNCGSPLETSEGWLVLTHGVGPMRTYRIGALLLDLEEPERVIADLPDPILDANENERNGYVPNVVYSCGGIISGDRLVLPYGISDHGSGIAEFSVQELLDALLANPVSRTRAYTGPDRRRVG